MKVLATHESDYGPVLLADLFCRMNPMGIPIQTVGRIMGELLNH